MFETSRNRCLAGLAVCIALLASAPSVRAQVEVIRIVVGGIEKQIYLPAALAERLGYFKEQGLDVQLLSDTSGVNAEDALLSGGVQGVVGFYDHTIDLQAKGKFVQSVVQFSQAPGEAEVVATRLADVIRTPADFKGRSLGVTGLGSSTHLLTLYLAATQGLKAGDLRISAIGSGPAFAAAIREGRIDAGMTTEPTVSRMLKSADAKLLMDLRTPDTASKVFDGIYPGACLYMNTVWVTSHRPQVQAIVNALVKALRYIDRHDAKTISAQLPTDYFLGDRDMYVVALQESKSMFISDGRMPATGPQTVLKVLRSVNRSLQGKRIDLARTYSSDFTDAAH